MRSSHHLEAAGSIEGAPELQRSTIYDVFACSVGEQRHQCRSGHVAMMAAAATVLLRWHLKDRQPARDRQPPKTSRSLLIDAWRTGVKAVAVYRDNCKVAQPLSSGTNDFVSSVNVQPSSPTAELPFHRLGNGLPTITSLGAPSTSESPTARDFVTVGEYDDGRPGEIFVRVSKQGSTLAGIMDAFAISLSHGLQYGVPLSAFVQAFVGMRFEPAGMTDDPELRIANSLIDYLCSAAWPSTT